MFNKYKTDWCTRMDSYGQGSKLRTYKLFTFSYCTEFEDLMTQIGDLTFIFKNMQWNLAMMD
jgi:hypothetical protein